MCLHWRKVSRSHARLYAARRVKMPVFLWQALYQCRPINVQVYESLFNHIESTLYDAMRPDADPDRPDGCQTESCCVSDNHSAGRVAGQFATVRLRVD